MKILQAAHVASQWHASQRRKGADREPYINHLIEVAALVAAAGASEEVICAAFLHDAIEDQSVSAATIASLFSPAVAALVVEVTDDKSLPKAERKAVQIAIASNLSVAPSSSGLPTKSATFDRSHQARRPTGPHSVGLITSNSAGRLWRACAAPTRCWKGFSTKPQKPPARRTDVKFRA